MFVPSIETRIFQAIKARVETLPMASEYEIVWTDGPLPKKPNGDDEESYTPSPTQQYLRCTWTPNATQRQLIASREPHRRPGVLQIDVMGLKAQGSGVAREVAGQVAAHFPADLKLSFGGIRAQVLSDPSVVSPFIDTHIQVPVSIEIAQQ